MQFPIVDFDNDTEQFSVDDVCIDCKISSVKKVSSLDKSARQSSNDSNTDCGDSKSIADDDVIETAAISLAIMCQSEVRIVSKMSYHKFMEKYKGDLSQDDFLTIRNRAAEIITGVKGVHFIKDEVYGEGTYIIVGDSHGAYENEKVSNVVGVAAEYLGAKIIHIGHAMDNFGNISSIARKDGVVVLALPEEIRELSAENAIRRTVKIVRKDVILGDVVVRNQAVRDDYTVGSTKNILSLEQDCAAVIVGRHSHEMHTLTKNDHICRIVSPGCLCENHMRRRPLKTIPSNPSMEDVETRALDHNRCGRRQGEVAELWEHGMIVVHVSKDLKSSIYPLRIKKTSRGFCSAYGRFVFTETDIDNCETAGLVVGDAHVSSHDPAALDVVDRVSTLLSPDYLVNLGDHVNCASLNHHKMDRNEPIIDEDIVNEFGKASSILQEMAKWSKKRYYLIGNHSRFLQDFHGKFPSLKKLLDIDSMLGASKAGYEVVGLKGVLEVGRAKYIHGDAKIYGAVGSDRHNKISSTMERDTMVGHCHNPSIRRGVYFIGMLGDLDQGYNEVEMSNWMHGFGLVTHYGGEVFMTTVGFENASLLFLDRELCGDGGCSRWNPPDFDIDVVYREKD
jgi:hypothetical protein